jgi:hypothetical protein
MTPRPAPVVASLATAPPLAADFGHPVWRLAAPLVLDCSWSRDLAPAALATTARLLWTAADLWVGFSCAYTELDIDADADPDLERHALWERDVCEIFVRSPREPHAASYKEFEVAPTGQWCDLAIHRPRVDVDWRWQSGMRTAAAIDAASSTWHAVMAVPFAAFGVTPAVGDRWHVNLFRIARVRGVRYYLAYAPPGTPTPDFHVPEAFVPLLFAPAAGAPTGR